MPEKTTKLTVRLPARDIASAKRYAQAHRTTVTAIIQRHLTSLSPHGEVDLPAEVRSVAGIIPASVDVREEYRKHQLRKHG